jgi:hypothetical protein
LLFMTPSRLSAAALALALLAGAAAADQPTSAAAVREICAADFQKACPDAKPGGGALKACAKKHFMSFAYPCRHALKALRAQMRRSGQAGDLES